MHSLIVPIQLFPTSQRDIPFQRVLSSAEELRGKTVELGDSMERGRGKKKEEERKGLLLACCKLSLLVFLFFCFFWEGGGNCKKNIQRGKLKRGESLSLIS